MTLLDRITMAPDLAAVGAAADRVRDHAIATLGQEGGEAVELAFVEAVNNIVQHGALAPGQRVEITLEAETSGLVLILRDPGQPIPAGVWDHVEEPEDPFAESSRGLWLIRTLMDEVSYRSDAGMNALTLIRRHG